MSGSTIAAALTASADDERFWIIPARDESIAPKAHLVCFPHAGAGGTLFLNWGKRIAANIGIVGVQLPGRSARLNEPPFGSIDAIVERMVPLLRRWNDTPWVLFGHSFGGAVAFELARALAALGETRLKGLVISSCPAPHMPLKRDYHVHTLPRDRFFREVHSRNGLPDEALHNEKYQDLIEPALRADFKCRELWSVDAVRRGLPDNRLDLPTLPIGGKSDPVVNAEDLLGWEPHVSELQPLVQFDGGHFYFQEKFADVAQTLEAFVDRVLET